MPISLGYATAEPEAVVTAIAFSAVLDSNVFELDDVRGFPTIRLPGWTPHVPLVLEGEIEVDGQALFRDCRLAPQDDVDCVLVARSFAKPGYRWVIDSFPILSEDVNHTVKQDFGQGLVGGAVSVSLDVILQKSSGTKRSPLAATARGSRLLTPASASGASGIGATLVLEDAGFVPLSFEESFSESGQRLLADASKAPWYFEVDLGRGVDALELPMRSAVRLHINQDYSEEARQALLADPMLSVVRADMIETLITACLHTEAITDDVLADCAEGTVGAELVHLLERFAARDGTGLTAMREEWKRDPGAFMIRVRSLAWEAS